jgi:hypothetical protein
MYQCFAAQGPVRSKPGVIDPRPMDLRAYVNPEQQMAPMPAAMACAVQAGDMPRMSMNDSQCAAMRCVEGQVCPCNRTVGFGGNQMQPRQPRPGVIDCAPAGDITGGGPGLGPCSQKPTVPGGVPVPSGGNPPVPGGGGNPPGVK